MNYTEQEKNYSSVIEKAYSDPTFKKHLIENPEQAISSVIGKAINVPEGYKIVVSDQSDPKIFNINIPSNHPKSNVVLTDDELELVSAGKGGLGLALAKISLRTLINIFT